MPAAALARPLEIPTPEAVVSIWDYVRYKGLYGGRGGIKSHSFANLLIGRSLSTPGFRAVCIREYQASLEQSVKRLLEDKIQLYGLGRQFRVLDNEIQTPGGGIIIFQGMQNHTADSIKSLEGYHVAWVEEAQSLSEHSLTLLRPTIRTEYCCHCARNESVARGTGCDSKQSGGVHRIVKPEIWFSWNPQSPDDPVDAMFRGPVPPPESICIRTSINDNPFLPDVLRQEMLWDRQRDPNKYAHVWLGEYQRQSQARVFKNWTIGEFNEPENPTYYQGADWGYSVDPSTLVRVRVEGRRLFIPREAYKVGVEIDHLPAFFDTVPDARVWPTIADSARPETISYMQRHGYPLMQKALKGKDSVKEGVIFLQSYDIIVHKDACPHTIDELTLYSYKVDKKTELVSNVLEDAKNHIIDPMRYAVEPLRRGGGLTW